MSRGKAYPQEARELVKELSAKKSTYDEIRAELRNQFKINPSDGWIAQCIKEGEEPIPSVDVDLESSKVRPTLQEVLKDYFKKGKATRIEQTFELSHGKPEDLMKILDIENVKLNYMKAIIFRLHGQSVMESLFGTGSADGKGVTPAKTGKSIDEEYEDVMKRELQSSKLRLLRKQIDKMSEDEGKGTGGMDQLSQIMMLDKMSRQDRTNSAGDIMGVVTAMKGMQDNTGQQVLLQTIQSIRDENRNLEELRIKERDLQYQRELDMRRALDNERGDALRREFGRLKEEQERAVSTPEDFASRLMYWREVGDKLSPQQKLTGDFQKDVEIKKLDLQDKALSKGVGIVDTRMTSIENKLDKFFDAWLNMMDRQQQVQLQRQGFGQPHPRALNTQAPLAPPPRTEDEREEAYDRLGDDVEKVKKLRELKQKITTHGIRS